MPTWVTFTKRTDGPKLAWLQRALKAAGIPSRQEKESWHAPILEVPKQYEDAAWAILAPIDDIDDYAPRWSSSLGIDAAVKRAEKVMPKGHRAKSGSRAKTTKVCRNLNKKTGKWQKRKTSNTVRKCHTRRK